MAGEGHCNLYTISNAGEGSDHVVVMTRQCFIVAWIKEGPYTPVFVTMLSCIYKLVGKGSASKTHAKSKSLLSRICLTFQ